VTAKDLRRVTDRAAKLAAARSAFRAAIMEAHRSGETYRDIAKAAGLSHNAIFKIVNEENRKG
jgi:hypothetical protein